MFETTVAAFQKYCEALEPRTTRQDFNRPASNEVHRGLKDLDYLIEQVRSREAVVGVAQVRIKEASEHRRRDLDARGLTWGDPWPPNAELDAEAELANAALVAADGPASQIQLYTESFYLFAWKIRTIINSKPAPFPGMGEVKSPGVRDVRNLLIEHYTPDYRLAATSFSYGGSRGPVIYSCAQVGLSKPYEDRGLYSNAEEFRDELDRRIAKGMQQYEPKPLLLIAGAKPSATINLPDIIRPDA